MKMSMTEFGRGLQKWASGKKTQYLCLCLTCWGVWGKNVMDLMSSFLKSSYVEALIPKWDGIWRWSREKVIAVRWGQEGGASERGLCLISRDTGECALSPFTTEGTASGILSASQEEGSHQQPEDPPPGIPSSRTVRNKCLLFQPFCLAAQTY